MAKIALEQAWTYLYGDSVPRVAEWMEVAFECCPMCGPLCASGPQVMLVWAADGVSRKGRPYACRRYVPR